MNRQFLGRNSAGICSSAAIQSSRAAVDLLNERIVELGNKSVGAVHISVNGLESQAVRILKVLSERFQERKLAGLCKGPKLPLSAAVLSPYRFHQRKP